MLDLTTTKQHFLLLTHEQKYQELLTIFESIKDKNSNCNYIHTMLLSRADIFSDTIMESVFDEVLQVYQDVTKDQETIEKSDFEKIRDMLDKIHEQEAKEQTVCLAEVNEMLEHL